MKNKTTTLIAPKTKARLKNRCGKGKSYDEYLNELLDIWENARLKPKKRNGEKILALIAIATIIGASLTAVLIGHIHNSHETNEKSRIKYIESIDNKEVEERKKEIRTNDTDKKEKIKNLNIKGDDEIIDTLEFDKKDCYTPDIIQISSDIYAIAYCGKNSDGFLKTVEIGTNGQITDTVIDTLEFDKKNGVSPDIIHVSSNIYAIAYKGKSNDGFLKTVEISSSGQITNEVIDTLEFDTKDGNEPNIIHISGDIFAIAYRGHSNDGFLKTVEISSSGQIANEVIDTLEFDASNGYTPNITHISGSVYAIAYTGTNYKGYLKTVEIATNGQITDTIIDSLNFDNTLCLAPNIIHISANIYSIAYTGASSDGYLKTVEIANNGQITDTIIDTLEFDTTDCLIPNIIHVSSNVYAIVYTGSGYDGFLKTVKIFSSGQINDTIIQTIEFDEKKSYTPNIIHVSSNIYAIAYTGEKNDGFLKTVEIEVEEEVDLDAPNVTISQGSPHIFLNWSAVDGAHHYNIYRYSPHISSLKSTSTWDFNFSNPYAATNNTNWTDYNACNISNSNFAWKYYYIVRAVDSNGNEEKNYNIIGKTSYHLRKRYNYIWWLGDTMNITDALATINGKYNTVQRWNITAQKYESFNPNIPIEYCDFITLEHNHGYLIDIKNEYPNTIWTYFEYWNESVLSNNNVASISSPSEFNLTVSGDNIKLNWSLVSGATKYNIYRTTRGYSFNFSSPVANTTNTEWIDYNVNNLSHSNFSSTYYYVVRAVDTNGYEEKNFNVVAKISCHLRKRYNYIWWYGETTNITEALKSIEGKYNTVQRWNITAQKYESFNPNIPIEYCDFTTLEHNHGYFIDIKNEYPNTVWTFVEG